MKKLLGAALSALLLCGVSRAGDPVDAKMLTPLPLFPLSAPAATTSPTTSPYFITPITPSAVGTTADISAAKNQKTGASQSQPTNVSTSPYALRSSETKWADPSPAHAQGSPNETHYAKSLPAPEVEIAKVQFQPEGAPVPVSATSGDGSSCGACTSCQTGCASKCGGWNTGKLRAWLTYRPVQLTPLGECATEPRFAPLYTFFLGEPCRETWRPKCCERACGGSCGSCAPSTTPVLLPGFAADH